VGARPIVAQPSPGIEKVCFFTKKSPLFGYFFRRSGKSNRPPRRRGAARSCQVSPQLQTPQPRRKDANTKVKANQKGEATTGQQITAPTSTKNPGGNPPPNICRKSHAATKRKSSANTTIKSRQMLFLYRLIQKAHS
jgi:hypothetical protein